MSGEDPKTVSEQIDEMLNIGVEEPSPSPELVPEPIPDPVPAPVPEPALEPVLDPILDPVPVPDPVPEPKSVPAPVPEPKPETDLERLTRENESLRKTIDGISGPKPIPEPKPEAIPEPKPESVLKLDEIDFIGKADVDEIIRDSAEFNKLLNKIYAQGVDTTRKVLGENILRGIPDIVKNNVTTVIALREMSNQFYRDNEDLKPFEKVVGAVFEEIAAENPDKKISEMIGDVEKETRKRLELYKKAIEPKPKPKLDEPITPRLPGVRGQRRESQLKPDVSPMLNEIDEMNKILMEG